MKLKSLLHYDMFLEKYDKLVKIRKLAKYGKIGPSNLKMMLAKNCVEENVRNTWG